MLSARSRWFMDLQSGIGSVRMPRGACHAGVRSKVATVFSAPARGPLLHFELALVTWRLPHSTKVLPLLALQFLPGHYVRSRLEMDGQCTEIDGLLSDDRPL